GTGASLDSMISFYGELIDGIVAEGVRPVLNIGVPSAVLGRPTEQPYVTRLETLLGDNGLSFEQPFYENGRVYCDWTQDEIALIRRWLGQGKLLLISSTDDLHPAPASRWSQSYWIAAM